jgi:hypothetical protein
MDLSLVYINEKCGRCRFSDWVIAARAAVGRARLKDRRAEIRPAKHYLLLSMTTQCKVNNTVQCVIFSVTHGLLPCLFPTFGTYCTLTVISRHMGQFCFLVCRKIKIKVHHLLKKTLNDVGHTATANTPVLHPGGWCSSLHHISSRF